jgi:protein-histidine pros-kinase
VTEDANGERVILDSQRFLDSVLEHIPDMVFVKEAEELRFVRINQAGERLFGHPRAEIIGRTDHDFFPAEVADFSTQKDREVLASGEILDIPQELIETPEGHRTLHTRKLAIPGDDGEPAYLLGISEDITQRELAEQRFRGLLEAAPDAMLVADRSGVITLVNAQLEELLGYGRSELVGRNVDTLVPGRFRDGHAGNRASYWENPKVRPMGAGMELYARRKDGTEVPVEISLSPVHTHEGQLVTAAIRDTTERRRVQQEMKEARAEAERANLAKSEFLSRMSHELRTPLTAIIGFAQLLELDDLDEGQDESVEQILKGGRHLLELIDEVLDISRIETGDAHMSLESVHLGSALADARSLIRPLADDVGVSLDIDPSRLNDVHVLADNQRLKQVLINVLSNAVKYNRPGGSVTVEVNRSAAGRVVVSVSDTGRGMNEEQLSGLFNPFDRLGAEHGEIEGTGLGLALSRRLVELFDGTIEAESEPGVGTVIRIELGEADAPEDAIGNDVADSSVARERPLTGSRTVLYVEDNLSNLRLVERLLERQHGVKLIPAMQGRMALELAHQHVPDLILLDIHLPDVDGGQILKRLKADPVTAGIPVVMVSADATPAQIERLGAAGAADYLTKPIDVQRLLEVIMEA